MRRTAFIIIAIIPTIALAPGSGHAGELLNETLHTLSDYFRPSGGSSGGGGHSGIKGGRPDSRAPAGLMGDHAHKQGEMMFEYRFMSMDMDDNRVGSTKVSDVASLDASGISFMATPTRMHMDMHMIHMMYGWSDRITLYAMPMWVELTMDHRRRMPLMGDPDFTTSNGGFGDTALGVLWKIYNGDTDELTVNLGFTVPTGDITARTAAPSNGLMPSVELPYPMRLGSGTFDARPGITYKQFWETRSFGMQYQTDLPIGRNFDGYSEGDEHRLNFWLSQRIGVKGKLAFTFRVENLWRSDFDGFDNDLGPANTVISTARTDFRGGYWLNFGYGATWRTPGRIFLIVEIVQPIYQDLNGVQLETDMALFATWSKRF